MLTRILVAVLAVSGAASAQVQWNEAEVDVLTWTKSVQAGDVDGDGLPDLVVTRLADNPLTEVALRQPGGGFGELADPGLPLGEYRIADLDADGVVEWLRVRAMPPGIQVFALEDGVSTLLASLPLPVEAVDILVHDLDRDAHADLIVNMANHRVMIFSGDGTGAFPVVEELLVGSDYKRVRVGDVDGNGRDDLVIWAQMLLGSRHLFTIRQAADGSFGSLEEVAQDVGMSLLAVGDANGDGTADLLTTRLEDGSPDPMVLFLGGPAGLTYADELAFGGPSHFVISDVDDDGADEFLVIGTSEVIMTAPAGKLVLTPTRMLLDRPILHDMDLDGHGDLVGMIDPFVVSVWHGTGGQHWRGATPIPPVIHDAAIGDVNSDGRPDVVTTRTGQFGPEWPATMVTLGAFGRAMGAAVPLDIGQEAYRVDMADLDGDGHLDLVEAGADGVVVTALGDGTGGFSVQTTWELNAVFPNDLAVADVDADGTPDIVVLTGNQVHVFAGDGAGGLAAPVTSTVSATGRLRLADLDADGALDLLTSGFTVAAHLGLGDGSFGPAIDSGVSSQADTTVGEFTGDGIPDFVIMALAPALPNVQVHPGLGDGSFGSPLEPAFTPVWAHHLLAADLDDDGDDDLVVGSDMAFGASRAMALINQNGQLEAGDLFSVAGDITALHLADMDADGRLDLVTPVLAGVISIAHRADGPWHALPYSLAGPQGLSELRVEGTLETDSPLAFQAVGAPPAERAVLVAGFDAGFTPFLGGVLVPTPMAVLTDLMTDAEGTLTVSGTWRGQAPGTELYVQVWFPAVPAATIAVKGTVP